MNPSPTSKPVVPVSFGAPSVAATPEAIESDLRTQVDGMFRGAVVYEAVKGGGPDAPKGLIHIGNPYSAQGKMRVTTLPTACTAAEIEKLRSGIIWMPETCALFELLAANFYLRQNLCVEGPSSLGKTWVANKFIECVFGPGKEAVYVCCNRDMLAKDLFAKWAPTDTTKLEPKLQAAVEAWLQTSMGESSRTKINALQKAFTDANLPSETLKTIIDGEYISIANQLGLLNARAEFQRELGPVAQAYLSKQEPDGTYSYPDTGGTGRPLFIDELSRAKPDLHNGIISIRGSNRELKARLTPPELGGKEIRRGRDTWLYAAMNPSDEDFEGVTNIDPALARAFVWVKLSDLSPESYAMAAESFLGFSRGDTPRAMASRKPFKYMESKELLSELGEVLAKLHLSFRERFGAWQRTRDQKIPTTLDDMASFAKEVYLYPITTGGKIDVAETVRAAYRNTYMQKSNDSTLNKALEKDMEDILTSKATATKRWRGGTATRADILKSLGEEYSLPPAARRAVAQNKLSAATASLLSNGAVPDAVKQSIAGLDLP